MGVGAKARMALLRKVFPPGNKKEVQTAYKWLQLD